ncbi:MAG TPA: PIN domain-containing protein [Candidatus Limnocylindrales bacterium]
MSLFDSSALIALVRDEPAADEVSEILRGRDGLASISTVGIAELMDVLVRVAGRRVEEASAMLGWLLATGIDVVPVDEEIGRLAGTLRSRHWRRDRRLVSMADCIVLATGIITREAIATTDSSLVAAARAEGHPVIVLPDSQGRLPA